MKLPTQFNFYDLFAYAIPGASLTGLMVAFFSAISGSWPTAGFWSAGVFLLFSHVLGMYLQEVARVVVPSETENGKYPSIANLEIAKIGIGPYEKLRIYAMSDFRLDIKNDSDAEKVLQYCRAYLQHKNAMGYTQQFQGLQGMSRGLAVVAAISGGFGGGMAINYLLLIYLNKDLFLEKWYPYLDGGLQMLGGLFVCYLFLFIHDKNRVIIPLKIKPTIDKVMQYMQSKLNKAIPTIQPADRARVGALIVSGLIVGGMASAHIPAPSKYLLIALIVAFPIGVFVCDAMVRAHKRFAGNFASSIYTNYIAAHSI